MNMDIIEWMQSWAQSQCNDYWEHLASIRISMIDNPGWEVLIALEGTHLEGTKRDLEMHHQSDQDWYGFKIENNLFEGFGDIHKLHMILMQFRKIVEASE